MCNVNMKVTFKSSNETEYAVNFDLFQTFLVESLFILSPLTNNKDN